MTWLLVRQLTDFQAAIYAALSGWWADLLVAVADGWPETEDFADSLSGWLSGLLAESLLRLPDWPPPSITVGWFSGEPHD